MLPFNAYSLSLYGILLLIVVIVNITSMLCRFHEPLHTLLPLVRPAFSSVCINGSIIHFFSFLGFESATGLSGLLIALTLIACFVYILINERNHDFRASLVNIIDFIIVIAIPLFFITMMYQSLPL